jgi:hypothetical protein
MNTFYLQGAKYFVVQHIYHSLDTKIILLLIAHSVKESPEYSSETEQAHGLGCTENLHLIVQPYAVYMFVKV